jgi:hypothetical protein
VGARPRGRTTALILAAGLLCALALQFVGPVHTNPAVERGLALEQQTSLPPDVRRVLSRACYDCHSHETRWPWYGRIAPVSWLVVSDVDEGRRHLNFSTWGAYHRFERADLLDASCALVSNGTMPLRAYRWMHADARLTPADVAALCTWARAESGRLAGPPIQ